MIKRPLIFVGSRSNQALLHIAAELNGYEILGILDHHYYGDGNDKINNVPVIGDERWLLDPKNKQAQHWLKTCEFFPGNWWNGNQHTDKKQVNLQQLRLDRIHILEKSGAKVINIIHPSSLPKGHDSKYASLKFGKGIFVDDDCWICPHQVSIGDYSVVMMNAKVTAHSQIGFNVCIGPAAYTYACTIGDNSYLGMFTKISLNHKTGITHIGNNVTTWAHSDVKTNIPDNCIHTDQGRILKKKESHGKD
jgi:carbonic anhydrase/acetyltransferase-like protein (isoleucine patch superfamily)